MFLNTDAVSPPTPTPRKGSTALVALCDLVVKTAWSHSDTPHSIWLLWKGDQPEAETSTWQHTALTRDMHQLPPVEFEPAIPETIRKQTHTLHRAATGIGEYLTYFNQNVFKDIYCDQSD